MYGYQGANITTTHLLSKSIKGGTGNDQNNNPRNTKYYLIGIILIISLLIYFLK